jgi:uncharacterized OsmC-like protein
MKDTEILVRLNQTHGYQFEIIFGDQVPNILGDEPAPLGTGLGPSPVQMLAAAVGNCLSASILFTLKKFKQSPEPISCDVSAEMGRNSEGRLRVVKMNAKLIFGVPASSLVHLDRVLEQFEAYCTVTKSVGLGIPIFIEVVDALGVQLKSPAGLQETVDNTIL